MKISTRGRYSLRMLIDLAEHQDEGYIPLKEIAGRQGISKKYLEQIVTLLNNSDILRTSRGYRGGYMLAKEPDQYTVGQILRITEGSLAPVSCLDDEVNLCKRAPGCKALSVWQGLQRVVDDYLDGITLQSLLDDCSGESEGGGGEGEGGGGEGGGEGEGGGGEGEGEGDEGSGGGEGEGSGGDGEGGGGGEGEGV